MKIHEYQAKEIFAKFGIPVPYGEVARTPLEAQKIAEKIGLPAVVKAQVHVGGRGKAGGIKIAQSIQEVYEVAKQILEMQIKGLPVKKVLVTQAVSIKSEIYIGIIVDRKNKKPVVMGSQAGGIDIEEVAKKSPEKIIKIFVEPDLGLLPFQARRLAFELFSESNLASQASQIILNLYKAFWESEASLAEINPLIISEDGKLIALDAKIDLDDNGLLKRPELESLRDLESEEKAESEARSGGLSFVKMEGEIGCIVNGAGLAMATMDLVKYFGAEPANFLDIGGSSSPDKVIAAMNIILKDPKVKVILFNIFGGITRCDDVALGIVSAVNKMQPKVPIVVRLVGTNQDKARQILEEVNLPSANRMEEVVKKAIELSGKEVK